jgi:hypothetical protein
VTPFLHFTTCRPAEHVLQLLGHLWVAAHSPLAGGGHHGPRAPGLLVNHHRTQERHALHDVSVAYHMSAQLHYLALLAD